MILQKEFFFVRHGQTDHNLFKGTGEHNHSDDIPLNEMGRNQAQSIEPIISSLPIQTVCSSPLKRAQETKEIIASKLRVNHQEINDLSECSFQTWKAMVKHGMYSPLPEEGVVSQFMDRVRRGINLALSLPGPTLVVAHGGVHWAICCLMGIEEHKWMISNCIPIHFSLDEGARWRARQLVAAAAF